MVKEHTKSKVNGNMEGISDEYLANSKDDKYVDIDSFRLYLREIGQDDLLTRDEESELAIKAQNGDEEARNELARRNQRLAVSIAKKYVGYSSVMTIEDLSQEGCIGIIRAIETYDPTKSKFSTYATWWVRQTIQRSVSQSDAIRLPVHMSESTVKYKRWVRQFHEDNNRNPTEKEARDYVKKNLKCDYETLIFALMSKNQVYINEKVSSDEDTEVGDLIPENKESIESIVIKEELVNEVREVIGNLFNSGSEKDERTKDVLNRRFGLTGKPPQTLEEVAQDYGVTRERIRQVESKALMRLRVNREARERLRPYMEGLGA